MSDFVGRTLFPGMAEGPVAALSTPLSFWGGFDPVTGRIIDRWHPEHGQSLSGHIVLMAGGRGSSSSSSVLAEALRLGTAPAAFVLEHPDSILLTGILVADELYGAACPLIILEPDVWMACRACAYLHIAALEPRAYLKRAS